MRRLDRPPARERGKVSSSPIIASNEHFVRDAHEHCGPPAPRGPSQRTRNRPEVSPGSPVDPTAARQWHWPAEYELRMSRELHAHGFWRRPWMFGNIAQEHLASVRGRSGGERWWSDTDRRHCCVERIGV